MAHISIHDVTPAWEEEVVAAYNAIGDWGLPAPSLFVVPNHHGRWPLHRFPDFVDKLKSWIYAGSDVLLHGYYHLAENAVPLRENPIAWMGSNLLTSGEGEFLALSDNALEERLCRGKTELEELLEYRVSGFVPPAWLRQRHLATHLRRTGFAHYEGHFYLYDLLTQRRYFVPAITFSARSWLRVTASIRFAQVMEMFLKGQVDIRLALHPADFRSKRLVQAAGLLAQTLSSRYQWVGYNDLLGGTQ